jgi:hypothetical protein
MRRTSTTLALTAAMVLRGASVALAHRTEPGSQPITVQLRKSEKRFRGTPFYRRLTSSFR